jgi:hypothetical protein
MIPLNDTIFSKQDSLLFHHSVCHKYCYDTHCDKWHWNLIATNGVLKLHMFHMMCTLVMYRGSWNMQFGRQLWTHAAWWAATDMCSLAEGHQHVQLSREPLICVVWQTATDTGNLIESHQHVKLRRQLLTCVVW